MDKEIVNNLTGELINPEVENIETDIKNNALLQQKKNKLRKALKEKGILPKGAKNDYDDYEYFSEAQYKELFTELFSQEGLEWTPSEYQVVEFKGTDKQPFGRRVTMVYHLQDIETGYEEITYHSGEAIDKGDKALYKAKTGALKSYFASTFLVATKDDPEREDDKPATKKSVVSKPTTKKVIKGTISPVQDKTIRTLFKDNKKELLTIMKSLKKVKIEELNREEASEIIKNKKGEK